MQWTIGLVSKKTGPYTVFYIYAECDLKRVFVARHLCRLFCIDWVSCVIDASVGHSPGVLFCVGGRGGSGDPFRSIECYSISKNSWFFGPEMNSRRRHVGVISVGGEEGKGAETRRRTRLGKRERRRLERSWESVERGEEDGSKE